MRKVYTSIILLITMLFGAMSIAQEQQKRYINYQGVARKADGTLMDGEPLTIGIGLKFGSASSETLYEETHNLTADANGVFSLLIGNGNSISGDYNDLPWGSFATFASVSMNGSQIGITELMAVPHALSSADNQWHTMGDDIENKNGGNVFVTGSLYASKDLSLAEGAAVNEFSTDITLGSNSDEIVPTQKAIKTYVDGQLGGSGGGTDDQTATEVAYDNSTSGLTASTAQDAIDELVTSGAVDADSDPNNEIQALSFDIATSELSLTDGGSVILPSGGTDADADPNNEIQDISLSGTELTISDGSTIDLAPIIPPGGTDDQNAGEVPYDNTASGLAATDSQAAIDELASGGLVDTDDQALILTGDVLTIEDGAGSVDLSAYKDDLDKTSKTGILIGDGASVTGLIGTADGQIAKWNAGTSSWEAGTDDTGGGGGGSSTGLEAIDEGNGAGWRLIGRDPNDYGNIGENAVDLSHSNDGITTNGATGDYAVAMGESTKALGNWSIAMGRETSADGQASLSMGFQTSALGDYSVTFGRETIASGTTAVAMNSETSATNDASTAMGFSTRANGRASVSMGVEIKADAYSALAMGRYNIGGGHPTNWLATDPIFEVGIGSGNLSRANALTILKNGNIGIGNAAPTAKLEVDGNIRSSDLVGVGERNVVADASGNLIVGAGGGGSSPWTENGSNIHFNGGNVGIGTNNPSAPLEIKTANGRPLLIESTSNNSYMQYATPSGKIGYSGVWSNDNDVDFGTTDSNPTGKVHLTTLATPKLTVTADGDVGIGTTTPTAKLDVDGNIRIRDLAGVDQRNVMANADGNLVIGSGGGGPSGGATKIDDLQDGKSDADGSSIFIGSGAGDNDDGSNRNAAFGNLALSSNTEGSENTAVGSLSLPNNEGGRSNTANGSGALFSNTSGNFNTALGATALYTNNTGGGNTPVGFSAMYFNNAGESNTALGVYALNKNTIGSRNVAVGNQALINLIAGDNNIGIGYDANVPNLNESNQVRIGNSSITYAGVQVAWTVTSDTRWKKDVQNLSYGLNMISQLRPVDYVRKNSGKKTREIGFIAQEVEQLLKKLEYKDQGMLAKDDQGYMSLRYNDFIPILTKAVQELKTENDSLRSRLQTLTTDIEEMNAGLSEMTNQIEIMNGRRNTGETPSEK